MPILSRFLGIVIAMYWDDHSPPHFHAKYGGYEITVEILTGVVEGKIQGRLKATGIRPKFVEKFEVMGISLPADLFGFSY